jgi:hypothetical protein
LVAFFGLQSTVFDYRRLTNKDEFLAALQETLKFERDWTLADFHQRLEFLAVMCVVDQTFDKVLFRKYAHPSSKEDFYRFHKAMFEFLLAKTEEKLIPLLQLFSKENETQPNARMHVGLLYQLTEDFLMVNLDEQMPKDWSAFKKAKLKAYKGLPRINLYHWMRTFSREESRFYRKSFVVALHDVGCFYIESVNSSSL